MAVKIGINGFGRIGRNVLRSSLTRPEVEIVAVNDLADAETLAHLLMYDSVHGICKCTVTAATGKLVVNGREIKVFGEKDPGNLPWGDLGVQIVVESTGHFTDGELAAAHLSQGVKKVLITAPAKNEDVTIVMGVNDGKYVPRVHHIISCASCTTNCLAPIAKVLHERFKIKHGMMTTVHSYTNDQQILDLPHKDLRRARAAALSIIPTSTGAAKTVALVLPELKDRLNGMAIRVPTPNVSLVDFVAELGRPVSRGEVNALFKKVAASELKGILDYCEAPLVSRDFYDNPHSSIIDALSTLVVNGVMVKVVAWYDNEWGYSNRVVDTIVHIMKKGF